MRALLQFLKATAVGGILFLTPIILLAAIVGKAIEISKEIVAPLAAKVPVESLGGIESARLLAILVIVLFCFLAGLFARTSLAGRILMWLESTLLSNVPGYEFIKGVGESLFGIENAQPYQVVLARIEEAWQIAFLIELIEGDYAAVFVPDAPRPWSGSVFFMTVDRIRPVEISHASAMKCLRRLGVGSNALLGPILPGSWPERHRTSVIVTTRFNKKAAKQPVNLNRGKERSGS